MIMSNLPKSDNMNKVSQIFKLHKKCVSIKNCYDGDYILYYIINYICILFHLLNFDKKYH